MKIAARIIVLLLAAAALAQTASCAWFQKNEPKLICAGTETIADAPELVAIVTECATIAVSAENIVPCILAAAGSKWTEDVIACVANNQTLPPTGPATATATATGTATSTALATAPSAQTPTNTMLLTARTAATIKPENIARLKAAVSAKWGSRLGIR